MSKVKEWITVHPNGKENKGQPIPVMDGQTKGEAVKSFVDKKQGDKSYRQNTGYKEISESKQREKSTDNSKSQTRKDKYGNPLLSDEAFMTGVMAVNDYLLEESKYLPISSNKLSEYNGTPYKISGIKKKEAASSTLTPSP